MPSEGEWKAMKARTKKLEQDLSLEREQMASLTKWIQETLRPGIEALKSSMKQRVEKLERELEEERKRGSLWISERLGSNMEKLQDYINKTVQKELAKQRAINPREVAAVEKWLKREGLACYANMLIKQGYTSRAKLALIGENELDGLGIYKPGHRKLFLHSVRQLEIEEEEDEDEDEEELENGDIDDEEGFSIIGAVRSLLGTNDKEDKKAQAREAREKQLAAEEANRRKNLADLKRREQEDRKRIEQEKALWEGEGEKIRKAAEVEVSRFSLESENSRRMEIERVRMEEEERRRKVTEDRQREENDRKRVAQEEQQRRQKEEQQKKEEERRRQEENERLRQEEEEAQRRQQLREEEDAATKRRDQERREREEKIRLEREAERERRRREQEEEDRKRQQEEEEERERWKREDEERARKRKEDDERRRNEDKKRRDAESEQARKRREEEEKSKEAERRRQEDEERARKRKDEEEQRRRRREEEDHERERKRQEADERRREVEERRKEAEERKEKENQKKRRQQEEEQQQQKQQEQQKKKQQQPQQKQKETPPPPPSYEDDWEDEKPVEKKKVEVPLSKGAFSNRRSMWESGGGGAEKEKEKEALPPKAKAAPPPPSYEEEEEEEAPVPVPKKPKAAPVKVKQAPSPKEESHSSSSDSESREQEPEPAPKRRGGRGGGGGGGGGGGSEGGSGGDSLVSLEDAVLDVKKDSSDTNWCLFSYSKQSNNVVFEAKGSGGHEEFMEALDDGKVQYGLLRLISGDRESKRVKFVMVIWVGSGVTTILKAKSNTQKNAMTAVMGQFHVEVRGEGNKKDLELPVIMQKIRSAQGADYDTGSNASGYESQAGNIKAKALNSYLNKEKQGNLKKVVFEKHALASTTPCDLAGRPMVAPPTEALKNIKGFD